MKIIKTLTFWLMIRSAHNCVLSSDLEMEQRLHADDGRILADYAQENGHD